MTVMLKTNQCKTCSLESTARNNSLTNLKPELSADHDEPEGLFNPLDWTLGLFLLLSPFIFNYILL